MTSEEIIANLKRKPDAVVDGWRLWRFGNVLVRGRVSRGAPRYLIGFERPGRTYYGRYTAAYRDRVADAVLYLQGEST